jgi:toxin ParE1/3/4
MPPRKFEVELTQGAEDDLDSIYRYLAENRSSDDAERLLDAFLDKIRTLERYPLRGSVPKELESIGIREYRQVLMKPYRLIYRVAADEVFIMLIADGRRDMQALLERRLLGRGT